MKDQLSNHTEIMTVLRRSRRGVPVYEVNPFWEPYEVKVGKKFIRVSGGIHTSTDTGEEIHHSGVHIVEEKDEDEFIKVYSKNIKAFFDLRPTTLKVLMYIFHVLQKSPKSEALYLNWFSLQDFAGKNEINVSETSFHRSMNELLNKGFLAEATEPNKYWINPHLFFNGDRMVFIREYRKKS